METSPSVPVKHPGRLCVKRFWSRRAFTGKTRRIIIAGALIPTVETREYVERENVQLFHFGRFIVFTMPTNAYRRRLIAFSSEQFARTRLTTVRPCAVVVFRKQTRKSDGDC